MLVAMQRPELVKRLVMISGGFNKSGSATPDMEFDVDQVVPFLGPAYGEVSPDGEAHFPVVAAKIGELARTEPDLDSAELARVRQRSLVMFADDDLMTLGHAVEMYDALPDAELAIVPGTSHFLTQEKPELVNGIVLDFLTTPPDYPTRTRPGRGVRRAATQRFEPLTRPLGSPAVRPEMGLCGGWPPEVVGASARVRPGPGVAAARHRRFPTGEVRLGGSHGQLAARPLSHAGRVLRQALGDDDGARLL
jgi:hypothetical protein